MTARNDITGDSITNSKGDQKKYAENWDKIFSKKLTEVYQDLASKQEPLGAEFEKAMMDNLSDLYADDEKKQTK
jgi:hypothetical protein